MSVETSTYKVLPPIEFEGGKNEVTGSPFMCKRYPITWLGREPTERDQYILLWADGSIILCDESMKYRVFFYDDQWKGIIEGLKQVMNDKEAAKEKNHAEWLAQNGDKKFHFGADVTYSINETKRILAEAPIRWGEAWYGKVAEILVDGKWLHLCRTDLCDDICTGRSELAELSLEENRDHYLRLVRYGARVRENDSFAVIDRTTDG